MRQLLQNLKTGETTLADVPVPGTGDGVVLVRNEASVVSAGTEKMVVDMAKKSMLGKALARPDLARKVIDKALKEGVGKAFQTVNARLNAPMPLGYSCCGIVEEAGALVPGLRPGQRVACAGAGYANHAEFVAVPKNLVVPVPEGVGAEDAAFTTLGAIALQGVRLAKPELGETFLVIGLGLLGQLTAQILLANGCTVLGTDLNAAHIDRAERAGAAGIRPGADVAEACRAATGGHGVDGVIVCAATVSSEPVTVAGEACRERGRVVLTGAVGMDVPRDPYFRKEVSLTVSRSYGPGRYDPSYEEGGHDYPYGYVRFTEQRNMEAFLGLLSAGKVDVSGLVTHRFDFADAIGAYGLVDGSVKEPYLGIVLTYAGAKRTESATLAAAPRPPAAGRIGVSAIGAGNYATGVLFPALKNAGGVDFRSIATASGRSAASAASTFGFARSASQPADVMDDDSQLVAVLTRHDSHAVLVADALAAGKHVFVEKPLALDVTSLVAVWSAAKAAPDRHLMVGFNRRFAPLTGAVRAHFDGAPGPKTVLIRANAGAIPMDHWTQDAERGGGRLIGEACHFVDLALALTGADVTAVTCTGAGTGKAPLLNDDFIMTLVLSDGSVATIVYSASGSAGMDKEYVEVFGGGRSAVIRDFRSAQLYGPGTASKKIGGRTQDKGQAAMIAALMDGLKTGTPAVAPDSAFRTTLATVLAVQSMGSGKTLGVDLDVLEADPAVDIPDE